VWGVAVKVRGLMVMEERLVADTPRSSVLQMVNVCSQLTCIVIDVEAV
jgi:hypothetical protein